LRWADRLSGERWIQPESPRWLGGDQLCWVDMGTSAFVVGGIVGGCIETVLTETVGSQIGSAARIVETDDWLVACDREFVRLRADGTRDTVARLPSGVGFLNDGCCDPAGRFWVGTQTADRSPRAALYSVGSELEVVTRLSEVTVSNGICFSADGRTLYYIDTLPHRSIEAFDLAPDGGLSRRRIVASVDGGNPDGMAIDAEGSLWVAVWNAGEARRYSPEGRLLDRIRVPARRATAVALVGSTLVIATAVDRTGAPGDEGGHFFATSVDTPGCPAVGFHLR
jgi:sugar lactone lactonase YvrE